MNEIKVTLDWSQINTEKLGAFIVNRFFGYWSTFYQMFAPFFVVGIVFAVLETDHGPADKLFLSLLSGAAVHLFLTMWRQRKFKAARDTAPFRQEVATMLIGPQGITGSDAKITGLMPWRWVTEILEAENTVLLMMAPVDYLVVPISGLPEGMTRSEFVAQIEVWRSAAL